jgi:hypothetical protein
MYQEAPVYRAFLNCLPLVVSDWGRYQIGQRRVVVRVTASLEYLPNALPSPELGDGNGVNAALE